MHSPTLMRNYNLNFSPRVGFAYTPFDGKHGTVIRGAYGRYIYPEPTRNYMKNIQQNTPYTATYSQSYVSASQSPDGLPNYLLRAPQPVVMGVNSSNVVNSASVTSIQPGIWINHIDPDFPPDFVSQVNFTIEQPFKGNSALRLTWLWSHGTNLDQIYEYNNAPGTYAWEMQNGIVPPTGALSGVATLPYDKKVWGSGSIWEQKGGWSNDNALQASYQRLFHHGIAYQVSYVWSKPLRVGGNTSRDSAIYPSQDYVGNTGAVGTMTSPYGTVINPVLPPSRPAGLASYANWHDLNVFENYKIDSAIPKQRIRFNGIVDLPFGTGKRFLGNANRLMNELVGGYQLAGAGQVASQDFQPYAGNWGPTNPIQTYKHNTKITDCRSGVCHMAYQWFNGYLAPTVLNATTKGVSGLGSNYAAYSSPIDTTVGTTYYNGNTVNVTLSNGQVTPIGYSPGPSGNNPYSKTFINGPINYTIDLSLFKVFPITDRFNLRFNLDAFNALNMQGYTNPNTVDGTESLLSSYNTPRQLQFTLRLQF
jgi:hypothetical protein